MCCLAGSSSGVCAAARPVECLSARRSAASAGDAPLSRDATLWARRSVGPLSAVCQAGGATTSPMSQKATEGSSAAALAAFRATQASASNREFLAAAPIVWVGG